MLGIIFWSFFYASKLEATHIGEDKRGRYPPYKSRSAKVVGGHKSHVPQESMKGYLYKVTVRPTV